MKVRLLKIFAVLCLALFAFGCDGGGGGGGGGGVVDAIPPDPASDVKLDMTIDNSLLNIENEETATLTILTRDANNVALGGVVVNLNATGGTLSAATVTTDAAGTAQVKFYSAPETTNQVVTVTATSGSLSKDLAITLATASTTTNAASLDITAGRPLLNIDNDESATLTIFTRDINNVALGGVLVNLTATGGTLSASRVTTDAAGTAQVIFSSAPETTNQVVTITATSGSLSKGLAITLATTSTVINATNLVISSDRSLLNIENAESAKLTILTRDANNVALGGAVVNLTATGGTLSAATVTTDATGTAQVQFYSTPETTNQVVTITATSGSLSKGLAITLATASTTTNATSIDIKTGSPLLNIDNDESATLTIFTRDINNVALGGVVVNLTATGGTLSASRVTTDAAGTAQVIFSSAPETTNQVVTITATSGSLSKVLGITLATTSTIVNPANLQISSDRYLLNIDTDESATLTILTRDANNVALGGAVVNLAATGGTLSAATVTTDATGTAQVKFYSTPETTSQPVTITATSGSHSKVLAINLATTASLGLSSDRYTLNADGSEQAVLTIFTRDANNAALGGVSVNLSADAGFLSASKVTTDATGKATVTFSPGPDKVNKIAAITATSGSLSKAIAITLVVPLPSSVAKVDMTSSKPRLNTNGADFATLTIVTRDANNVAIGDVVVDLSATAGFLSASRVTTNATGTATVTFSPGPDTANQVATVTATTGVLSTTLELTLVGIADPACNMVLTSNLPLGTQLSQQGEMTIKAEVWDRNGFNVEDGTSVTFQVLTPDAGTVTSSAATINGVATATFKAGVTGGPVTVRGTTPGTPEECADCGCPVIVYDDLSFAVASGAASTVTFVSAEPETIGVKSAGRPETTILTFQVLDSGGGPVANGTPVDFAIATPLGGGERVASAQATTISGYAQVALQSGTVAGTVAVRASIANSSPLIATTGKVIIVAGLPDSNHFGLAATRLNLPGYSCFGETATITAFVADRYANPVPVDTPVYFTSEAGAMVMDSTNMNPAFTNGFGQATAEHVTQTPTPDTLSTVTGLRGLSTILAWTAGQEAFVDVNGNGRYDSGELFDDFGEPFIDANDNGIYATNERYVDINGNGRYDGPNGRWDGATFVWNTIDILWSSIDAVINVTPGANCSGFVISDNRSCEITVTVKDTNGNPVIGGSTISIQTPPIREGYAVNPNYLDEPEFIISDANRPGLDSTLFKFAISNLDGGPAGNEDIAVVLEGSSSCGPFQKTRTFNVTLEAPTP